MMQHSFEQIVEAAPSALLVVDADHRIRYANRAAETTFGYARNELAGLLVEQLVPDRFRSKHPEHVSAYMREPLARPMGHGRELFARRKDGSELTVEIGLTPIQGSTGTFTLASVIDVSERRAIERQFRVLAESLPLMVWTCRGDGPCDYLSPQWFEYTGIPAEEQLGYRWLEQLHPDDREPTRSRWAEAAARGCVFDTEFRIRGSDGIYRWFKTRAMPIRDTFGVITKWIGSNTEIQELADARDESLRLNQQLEAGVAARTAELQTKNDELARSAWHLGNAQRITRVGSWELDARTGAVSWSDELFRILHMPPGIAPDFQDQAHLFTPESWNRLTESVANSVATGHGYEIALDVNLTDGTRLKTIARAEAIRDRTGEIVQLIGTLQDVTERELVSAQLRQLNDRLQLATSAADMGVWDWELATDKLVWDETMYRIYGIDPARFGGGYDVWRSAVHPDDRAVAERQLADAVSGVAEFKITFRIVRSDGAIRYIQAAAKAHRDPATGAPERIIGVNRDITVQRLAEMALQRSEAVQRAIVAHAGAAVIATDIDGTITLFNRSAEELLGYRASELIGHATLALIHDPEEIEKRRRDLEGELRTSLPSPVEVLVVTSRTRTADANEWTYTRKDGSRVPVLLTVTSIRDPDGAITGFLGVAIDLTHRKRAELELVELNRLLADRSAQREALLQEVHHRVKNNLQVITSLLSMQIRQLGDNAAKEALEETQTRVHAIALIHEQLYQEQNYASVQFSEYVKSLATSVFHASGISSAVSLDLAFEDVRLSVDKAIPCGLIVNELIVNAFKHAFPGDRRGTIHVALHMTDANHVTLIVQDDGCGMPERREGTAHESLGMRLVATLTRQLDGALEIESAPTRGTTVRVRFPIRAEFAGGQP